jgi:dienelactone hydrolase
MKLLLPTFALAVAFLIPSVCFAEDSLAPYATEAEVPGNVVDLWKDVDFRKDPLETEIVKEWTEDGVVCRYVMFTVGTFKGEASRIAAFYTFPEGAGKVPGVVWAHGGGQRADLEHGRYFAKHGYAMVDINWGGREILEGVEKNTDWGAIDPSQGPQFYPGARRQGTKLNLLPDEFTIDPVLSPRNGNWFMLAYAGRRAITFLEQQEEVDGDKIGFTGFSMGGNITSYVSIDPRLKAVVPMVGGAGFITSDSPGIPDSGMARGFKDHVELFANTMESQSYYPYTTCPVLLLSASDDFHSRFEFIYQCMDVLPHENWRVSQHMHLSHNLGPEQWILMNLWFDKYLKGQPIEIPQTATVVLNAAPDKGTATLQVTPDRADKLVALDVYYSHDPNPKSRFWISAGSIEKGGVWTAELPVREELPLYAFAQCTYPLEETVVAFQGTTSSFSITSNEAAYLPEVIKAERLFEEAKPEAVFTDFEKDGFRDWGLSSRSGITTYKFRDPRAATPSPDTVMKVTAKVPRGQLSYRFRIAKNNYITGVKDPRENYSVSREMKGPGVQEILLKVSDFVDREKAAMANWENIATFTFEIYDGEAKESLQFRDEENASVISRIEWVQSPPSFGRQVSESGICHSFLIAGNETVVVDEDGSVQWKTAGKARDGFVLGNGNILVSIGNVAKEMTPDGDVVWSYALAKENKELGTAVRLDNGNTLVVERGVKPRLLEVTEAGEVAVEVPLQPETDNAHMQTRMARKLPSGNYLVPHLLAFKVKEYQPDGTVVNEIKTDLEQLGGREARNWPFTAIRLDNGNTLVNLTNGDKIAEFDPEGGVAWVVTNDDVGGRFADPCGGQRLANGNTIICSYGQKDPEKPKLLEVTPEKKVVWEFFHPQVRAHEVHVLTTNGEPEGILK